MNDVRINRWGSLITILGGAWALARWILGLLSSPSGLPGFSGFPRMQAILLIGIVAAVSHGVLWMLAQRIFHWKFDAGGESLPHGWSAVVQSVTMTTPLLLLPPLYSRLTHLQIVLPGHTLAAGPVVLFAAVGHIFLYGAETIKFPGVRNIVFPLGSPPNWKRAFGMEFIYAVVHFASIALVYRVAVDSQLGPLNAAAIIPAVISALVWFFATSVFIFLRYPDSLVDKRSHYCPVNG